MKEIRLSDRLKALKPFRVMEIAEKARFLENQGRSIVHFEIGELDFPTAAPIVDRAKEALENGLTKYTGGNGLFELREEISGQYFRLGIEVDPEQILITNGASGGLLLLLAGLLDVGDRFLSTDPGYPCHGAFSSVIGALMENMTLKISSKFQPELSDFERRWSDSVKGILLSSPANPTGVVVRKSNLRQLKKFVDKKQGFLIVDEIYQGIHLGNRTYESALAVDQQIYVLNSFSKYYSMTGWRLGWVVVPYETAEFFTRLAQNIFLAPNTVSQYAALEAFNDQCLAIHEDRVQIVRQRMGALCEGLLDQGFTIPVRPEGGFYVFVDVSHTGLSSHDFCLKMLMEYGVAITPAQDFSHHYGKDHVRFSCSTDLDAIYLGLDRLRSALADWGI